MSMTMPRPSFLFCIAFVISVSGQDSELHAYPYDDSAKGCASDASTIRGVGATPGRSLMQSQRSITVAASSQQPKDGQRLHQEQLQYEPVVMTSFVELANEQQRSKQIAKNIAAAADTLDILDGKSVTASRQTKAEKGEPQVPSSFIGWLTDWVGDIAEKALPVLAETQEGEGDQLSDPQGEALLMSGAEELVRDIPVVSHTRPDDDGSTQSSSHSASDASSSSNNVTSDDRIKKRTHRHIRIYHTNMRSHTWSWWLLSSLLGLLALIICLALLGLFCLHYRHPKDDKVLDCPKKIQLEPTEEEERDMIEVEKEASASMGLSDIYDNSAPSPELSPMASPKADPPKALPFRTVAAHTARTETSATAVTREYNDTMSQGSSITTPLPPPLTTTPPPITTSWFGWSSPPPEPVVQARAVTTSVAHRVVQQPTVIRTYRVHRTVGMPVAGAERVLLLPYLQPHTSTYGAINDIRDVQGQPVMKAVTTMASRAPTYQQFSYHVQNDGLNILKATPFGQLLGMDVREHPVLVLHGASSWVTPTALGPVFARCRAGGETRGPHKLYLYDAKDELFGRIERQGEGATHYSLIQPGDRTRQLDFKGNFAGHSVIVTDGNGKVVSRSEPHGPGFYKLTVAAGIDWSLSVTILMSLLCIDVDG